MNFNGLNIYFVGDVEKNRLATKDDIAHLKIEMKEQKSEIIKWMLIFWASQIAATIDFIMLYIKK
jgi:hypothetical protein